MSAVNDLSLRSLQGDDEAARHLEAAVRHGIRVFELLLRNPSDKLRQRMAKAVDMPGLISLETDQIKLNKQLAVHVGLGTRCGRKLEGKQATRRTGPTAAVIRMYQELTEQATIISHLPIHIRNPKSWRAAHRLPPLSRETHPAWCEASWPLFYAKYGNNFEEHPQFRDQAKSVEADAKRRAFLGSPMSQAEQRAAVRKVIKRQIQLAWRSISARDHGG
jgi:hypothetical protein